MKTSSRMLKSSEMLEEFGQKKKAAIQGPKCSVNEVMGTRERNFDCFKEEGPHISE